MERVVGLWNRALGDMACHTTNLAFMACELTAPKTVESVNTGPINSELILLGDYRNEFS